MRGMLNLTKLTFAISKILGLQRYDFFRLNGCGRSSDFRLQLTAHSSPLTTHNSHFNPSTFFSHFENDAEASFVEAGAGDAEVADFLGGGDVGADAGADVVVADADQTEGFGGIVGEFVEFHAFGHVVAGDELEGDGQVGGNEFVDAAFHGFNLFIR